MLKRLLVLLLSQVLVFGVAHAKRQKIYQEVIVADPYLEMHSGPGKGYPVFHVVDRGESVAIIKRKTDWFKVRTDRGEEGWVNRDEMEETLRPTGQQTEFRGSSLEDFSERKWESGVMGGDFGGADTISLYAARSFTENISLELSLSQILGNFSNGYMANIDVVHSFFPEWRASPFFSLGTGVIHTSPKATLVAAEDRTDQLAHVGMGVRTYITRRFIFRAEYKSYVVFTSRDENEEVREWKAGFAFFF